MTEIVKARKLHFLSGRDKNGSLVSISSVLAAANEIIKIAPSGLKDFNTELVVKIDQYPNQKKLPTNVLESERHRLRTVVYNRLDLEKVLSIEFKQDESSAFKIEFPETVTHPLTMEQLGVLLSRWHGYDITDADAILTHVRDNQYTITAKPNSLGYTGIATINAGDFVTVEPGEPEVPAPGAPTESFFFTNSEEVADLNVNGIVTPISELYQRYGVSVSVWSVDDKTVFGLVNTSTNTLQVTLPETAQVPDYNVNESLVTQADGARTFKLSPMIGVVEKPTPSEEILDDTELTFSVNVTDSNALGKLIECWVDGEKITFAASFENEKIKIHRNGEGDLVISNLAHEVTSVIVAVKTASLGHGEGVLFGSGVPVEIVDGYEVVSFNLAAVELPAEDPVPSNITLGSIKDSRVYSSLVALAGTDHLNEDELENAMITVRGKGTEVETLTINIRPYTNKGLLAIPFNIATDDWVKVSALPADTVVGEYAVVLNGDVTTTPLTAGDLSRTGMNNPDEGSYTFTLSAKVPFIGSIIFNLDFDTGSSNRYLPTTTTFEINVLNYVENWIKPEVLSPAGLKQFYGVDDVEFENDVSVANWLSSEGNVSGGDLFYNTELVYSDRRDELPSGPLFFSLSDAAKNYITESKESGQVLFTISIDGSTTEVTVSDLDIVTLTRDDVEKHYFKIDVTADQIKELKVIKVAGDLDGPFNEVARTGGLFGNSIHTFNYNVTVTPLPAIPSPVSVAPATEELVNFVIDRMNNEGIDVTDRALFGQYEETVEQNESYWTVTQLHPYASGTKQVSIFVTFPKEVLDKLETIPEDTVVFRAISDVEELAEALSLTALDVISQMFELGDSVYLPINHTVGTGVPRETTVWGVDFDGLENFYGESAFTLDILAEMEPAPSASVVNLLDIADTDIEHNYTLTDYSTFNGKDTLEYRVNQLGHGLDIHVPFSIPVEARNLLENSAAPEETGIVAKVNGNVVQTYTVEQISKWDSLTLDIANSHFTYTVPEEEAVHKNQNVTYDITFESDFDGTGRAFSQYTSEHSVVVRYEYDSQLCPVVPVAVTDKALYDQIKAKNPEMSTLDFEEFIKHEVVIDGLDVKIHVKEEVEYYQLPLFYKADSAFAYANVYPTVDTIIAQVDSKPLTAGTALTKVVEVDDEYYFVKMVTIGSTGDFHIIADWDGEEYSYCKQTTTSIPYAVYKYQISLYELPGTSVEKAIHTSQVDSIQPYLISSEGNANILTRDFVVDTADKGKHITLVYKVPATMGTYLATLPEDTVVLRFNDNDNGSLLDGTATAGDLAQSIRVQDGEHYMFFSVDTTDVATTIDVQMNVDWDGAGFVYREDSYRLINNFDWITPIVSELIPVDPNSLEFEDVLFDKLGDDYRKALHVEFAIDNVGNITRHDILDGSNGGGQTIYHVFAVPSDSKAALEAAADDEVVITIDGVGYSKSTLVNLLHVFEDNIYLVLEHTPEFSEIITQHTLEISQDWDGEEPYYTEGSTVLEHSAEFFTQSASIMEPLNYEVTSPPEALFDFVDRLNASGLLIPDIVSYTGTETVLKHTFDSYGDRAKYVFPMVIPNDIFEAIQSVAAEDSDYTIISNEAGDLNYTAKQIVDLVITANDVHYFPFIAPVVSQEDADNVTNISFHFDADGYGYEYGETLNSITISIVHEIPRPEAQVAITNFGKGVVLEGTYTPGYTLEVYSTENGERSKLIVLENEDEGYWTVLDYSQLDGIEYLIEAQLLHPDSGELMAEDSLSASNELEDPLGDPTTMPRILCEGATNEFYIRSNLDSSAPMISVNDGPWLSQNDLLNGDNQVEGLQIGYQPANPGAVMRFANYGDDPLHIRFNVNNNYGSWVLFNDGKGDGGVNDFAQDNSAFVMYGALGNVIDHTDPNNFDYNSGTAQLPTSETDYVVKFARIDFCLNPPPPPAPYIDISYDDLNEVPLHGFFSPLDADEIELSYRANGVTNTIAVEMDNESGTYTVPTFERDAVLGYAFEVILKRENEVLAENSFFLGALIV